MWWPDDQRFYVGKIVALRNKTKRWKVRYEDDGLTEWLDLRNETYRVLSNNNKNKKQQQQQQHEDQVVLPEQVVKNDVSHLCVGSCVSVWWEYYGQYYTGTVRRIRPGRTKSFFVQYEDGDARWEDLESTKFFLVAQEVSV